MSVVRWDQTVLKECVCHKLHGSVYLFPVSGSLLCAVSWCLHDCAESQLGPMSGLVRTCTQVFRYGSAGLLKVAFQCVQDVAFHKSFLRNVTMFTFVKHFKRRASLWHCSSSLSLSPFTCHRWSAGLEITSPNGLFCAGDQRIPQEMKY